MTEHYARHGATMTVTMIVDDSIYFEEPFIRSASFQLDPAGSVLPAPCEPQVEISRKEGEVPHYLPSTNPFIDELAKLYGIPLEAVRGGAMTTYPEYRKKLKDAYKAPEKCAREWQSSLLGVASYRHRATRRIADGRPRIAAAGTARLARFGQPCGWWWRRARRWAG